MIILGNRADFNFERLVELEAPQPVYEPERRKSDDRSIGTDSLQMLIDTHYEHYTSELNLEVQLSVFELDIQPCKGVSVATSRTEEKSNTLAGRML